MLNGENARFAVRAAFALVALLIVAMTVLVAVGKPIPIELAGIVTALIPALIAFLVGSRVVTPDVSASIKSEPVTSAEQAENVKATANGQ